MPLDDRGADDPSSTIRNDSHSPADRENQPSSGLGRSQDESQAHPSDSPPTPQSRPSGSSSGDRSEELSSGFWDRPANGAYVPIPEAGFSDFLKKLRGKRSERVPAPELKRIGPYEVRRHIGSGGFGHVYEGVDPVTANRVAIKIPRSERTKRDLQDLELWVGQRIHHPNVVGVLHAGLHEGVPFLVSPFVDGMSLSAWLKQRQRGEGLPFRTAASLMLLVSRGVECCHQHGVMHRDLKPGNILLDFECPAGLAVQGLDRRVVPRICDFGLARHTRQSLLSEGDSEPGGGTAKYMAPEQAAGEPNQTAAVDIHAIGVILYKLLTSRPPFQEKSTAATLESIIHDQPTPPFVHRVGVPRDLEAICLKCLQKKPEQRYATATDLAADLQAFLDGEPVAARKQILPERIYRWARRKPAEAAVAVIALVASLALVVGSVVYANDSRQKMALIQEQGVQLSRKVELTRREMIATALRRAHHLEDEEGDLVEATAVLDELVENLPEGYDLGFAYKALRNRLEQQLKLLRTDEAGIHDLMSYPSPDGQQRLLIASSRKGTLALWDPRVGQQVQSVPAPFEPRLVHGTNPARLFSFPRRFTREVQDAGHRLLHVFDPQSLAHVGVHPFPDWVTQAPLLAPLAPDRLILANQGQDRCEIRDFNTFELRSAWNAGGPVLDLGANAAGTRLAMLVQEPGGLTLDVLDDVGGALLKSQIALKDLVSTSDPPFKLALSPTGRHALVWSSSSAQMILIYLQTTPERKLLTRPNSGLFAFSPCGRWLASRTDNGSIEILDLARGSVAGRLESPGQFFHTFDFSADGRTLYAAMNNDPHVWVWSPSDKGHLLASNDGPITKLSKPITDIALASNGDQCALATDHGLIVCRLRTPAQTATVFAPADAVAFVQGGRALAASNRDSSGTISILDQESGAVLDNLTGHTGPVWGLSASANGMRLASVGEDRTVRVWNLNSAKGRAEWILGPLLQKPTCMALSPDGQCLLVADDANEAILYRIGQETPVWSRELPSTVAAAAFSPRDNRLALGDEAGSIYLLTTMPEFSLTRVYRETTHTGGVRSLAFHPSGLELAAGGDRGDIVLWDLSIMREVLPDWPHQQDVSALAFSANGESLISVSNDGTYRTLDGRAPFSQVTDVPKLNPDVLPPMIRPAGATPPPPIRQVLLSFRVKKEA